MVTYCCFMCVPIRFSYWNIVKSLVTPLADFWVLHLQWLPNLHTIYADIFFIRTRPFYHYASSGGNICTRSIISRIAVFSWSNQITGCHVHLPSFFMRQYNFAMYTRVRYVYIKMFIRYAVLVRRCVVMRPLPLLLQPPSIWAYNQSPITVARGYGICDLLCAGALRRHYSCMVLLVPSLDHALVLPHPSGQQAWFPFFFVGERLCQVHNSSYLSCVIPWHPLAARSGLASFACSTFLMLSSCYPFLTAVIANDMPNCMCVYPKIITLACCVSTLTFALILVKHILRFHMWPTYPGLQLDTR